MLMMNGRTWLNHQVAVSFIYDESKNFFKKKMEMIMDIFVSHNYLYKLINIFLLLL